MGETNASEKDEMGKICAILTDCKKEINNRLEGKPDQKQNCKQMACEDKAAYNDDTITSRKAVKDPNKPKRFITSFIFFKNNEFKCVRKDNPTWKTLGVMREIRRRWEGLS